MITTTALAARRILVVEDEYLIADELCAMLEQSGAHVVGPFGKVSAAMAELDAAIDAAVLDIRLTDGESYGVADALASRGIAFVFITGYTQSLLPPRFAGAPYVPKPFDEQTLVARLGQMLASAQSS